MQEGNKKLHFCEYPFFSATNIELDNANSCFFDKIVNIGVHPGLDSID